MRFSQQDLDVILTHIRTNPTNLSKGFQDAAEQLGRSYQVIKNLWYRKLRYTSRLFAVTRTLPNVKNTQRIAADVQLSKLSKKLQSRTSQKRQTATSRAEISRIKSAIRSLAKTL